MYRAAPGAPPPAGRARLRGTCSIPSSPPLAAPVGVLEGRRSCCSTLYAVLPPASMVLFLVLPPCHLLAPMGEHLASCRFHARARTLLRCVRAAPPPHRRRCALARASPRAPATVRRSSSAAAAGAYLPTTTYPALLRAAALLLLARLISIISDMSWWTSCARLP